MRSMGRVVVRPRLQVLWIVVLSTVWGCLGTTYFSEGDVIARRDWCGLALGCLLVIMGVVGVWRALRLGVVIDPTGLRVRGFDSRDRVIPWNRVSAVECEQIGNRAGRPLFGPAVYFRDSAAPLTVAPLGSYSRSTAQRNVDRLRELLPGDQASHEE